ncbi:MAG: ATP-dependent exoDNAse (exonuclease V) beta subunit [Flammeovirgaceae bacterium]|jgi:ATP-dependent exoDNAse (exonuclease V) beta subunit
MKRIIIICEGSTEQVFCQKTLQPYLIEKGISIQAPLIKHSNGGIVRWEILKKQIEIHLKTDTSAVVTTFIDYYGLYSKFGFPDWESSEKIPYPNEKMDSLENGMQKDIAEELRHRFIPYIQLHEFEGLLFNNIDIIYE